MDIKMPASVNSWLEHSAASLDYGELCIVFTVHQGKVVTIRKTIAEQIKL